MSKATTTSPHERSFAAAPHVLRGESVRILRPEDDEAPGWFFGVTADGVSGYFPVAWFVQDEGGETAQATRDYDAAELTIGAGATVELLARESAWVLVRTRTGEEGWIPERCIQ